MTLRWRPLLLAALVWAPVSHAGAGVEEIRAQSQASRARVQEIRSRQMALRGELHQVASRIETLKAQGQGKLLVGRELETALQRSQELSSQLGELSRELATRESDAAQQHLVLSEALGAELERLKAEWERTSDRATRTALVERMRKLRTEREGLRGSLPAGAPLPKLEASASDDPEDLFEQVDALRDSEDKVRQQMRALETRIAEAKQERDLDRRMNEFLGDESLFDESDRRLRFERHREAAATAERSEAADAPQVASTPSVENSSSAPSPQFDVASGSESAPKSSATSSSSSGDSSLSLKPSVRPQLARGVDSRPLVGGPRGEQGLALESLDLKTLEAELARLRRAAEAYGQRARTLEDQARSLDGR